MISPTWKSSLDGTGNDRLHLKPHWTSAGLVVEFHVAEGYAKSNVRIYTLQDWLKAEMRFVLGMFRTGRSERFVEIPGGGFD
jgi:hypothetical protein